MEGLPKKESSFGCERAPLIALCIFSALLFLASLHKPIEYFTEDLMFRYDHTAARAYMYGSKHFDANYSSEYNIQRASYFFGQGMAIDATYPFMEYQVARIDFLNGRYTDAKLHIDRVVEKYGDDESNAYYLQGLIDGFRGDYAAAAADYESYFKKAPANWAGINDYSWALMNSICPKRRFRRSTGDSASGPTTRGCSIIR